MGYKNIRVSDVTHSKIKAIAHEKRISLIEVVEIATNRLYSDTIYVDQYYRPVDLSKKESAMYDSGGEIIPNAAESYTEYLDRVLETEGVIRLDK